MEAMTTPKLLPADIILGAWDDELSHLILHFETLGDIPAQVSHVAGVIAVPGWTQEAPGPVVPAYQLSNLTITMEALQPGFQTRLYGQTIAGANKLWIGRDITLTMEERCAIAACWVQASCEPYSDWDLVLQAADTFTNSTWFTDELGQVFLKHSVICSMAIAKGYQEALGVARKIGLLSYDTITPQGIFSAMQLDPQRFSLTEVL